MATEIDRQSHCSAAVSNQAATVLGMADDIPQESALMTTAFSLHSNPGAYALLLGRESRRQAAYRPRGVFLRTLFPAQPSLSIRHQHTQLLGMKSSLAS